MGGTKTLNLLPCAVGVSEARNEKLACVATAATAEALPGRADTDITSLTASLAAGDSAAVEVFYRRYFNLLFRAARRAAGRDEAFCLDVVQEAVLRVIRSAERTESEAAWTCWLRLVVRTAAYDLLRAESRRRRRETGVAISVNEAAMPPAATACDDADERDARLAWLREQIAQLDPQVARAIDLRYHQRWKLARVAAALGLTIGTLDGKLRRALDRLRRQARQDWVGDHD